MFAVILPYQIGREYYENYLFRQWIGLVINDIVVNIVLEFICCSVIWHSQRLDYITM